MPPSKPNTRKTPDRIRPIVVGGGAREHALALHLKRSPSIDTVFATHPENPGIRDIAHTIDFTFSTKELYRLEQFIRRHSINLVVVGPEQPLADGIADKLAHLAGDIGCLVFGPNAQAAQLEANKAWAKKLMRSAAVPTAEARVFKDPAGAIEYLRTREYPHVVKASGLAAGKGVVVPETLDEAVDAVHALTDTSTFGNAATELIIEERLAGPEVSVFALTDGRTIALLDACQDHKRLLDNDQGPNTGGMGAYCPVPQHILPNATIDAITHRILLPTIDALKRESIDYRGVLYAGIILTHAGPKVLEFNARFGDPEAQCLLQRIDSDLAVLLYATAAAELEHAQCDTNDTHAVTVVLAAEGYPEAPVKGAEITGIDDAEDLPGVSVFHAGTQREDGRTTVAGGRVLSVTATADNLEIARDRARAAADRIHFHGKQARTDIAGQAFRPAHATSGTQQR